MPAELLSSFSRIPGEGGLKAKLNHLTPDDETFGKSVQHETWKNGKVSNIICSGFSQEEKWKRRRDFQVPSFKTETGTFSRIFFRMSSSF